MTAKLFHRDVMLSFLPVILAVALQIQITIDGVGDYFGLRINMADLFLPFIGPYILYSLIKKQTPWPTWPNRYFIFSIFAICLAFTVSLINGYLYNEYWSLWAVLNKYAGLYVLLSYGALGGWIMHLPKAKDLFLKYFCGFFVLTLSVTVLAALVNAFWTRPLWVNEFPWDGLMANRNVYVVTMVFTMIILEVQAYLKTPSWPVWMDRLFWALIPAFALGNASRTGWIMGGGILLISTLKNHTRFLKIILPSVLLGLIIAYGVYSASTVRPMKDGRQVKYLWAMVTQNVDYGGDQKRLTALEDGWELYTQSKPFVGSGLGTYKNHQTAKRGEFLDIMDCSALWLLVETGLLGFLSFGGFFLLCLIHLYGQGFQLGSHLHLIVCLFLLSMIIMSSMHELIYTRFLWFLLGMGMVVFKAPNTKPTQDQQ